MKHLFVAVSGSLFVVAGAWAEPELKGSPSELAQYLASVPRLVSILGEAEVKVPADRAVLTLRVTTENKSLKEALSANQQVRGKLAAYLQEQGLPADQVQAAKFASTPRHGTFSDKVKSYRIDNEVRVTTRGDKEFQAVASALDKWSDVTYAGVVFEHTDKEALRQKAVAQACDNASARKKTYEEKLGLKLTPKGFGDGAEAVELAMRERLTSGLRNPVGVQGGATPSTRALGFDWLSGGTSPAQFDESLNAFGEVVFKARVLVQYAVEPR